MFRALFVGGRIGMKITNLIKRLSEFEPDGYPFLSVYIDAGTNEIGREDYPVWLKTQIAEERSRYSENKEEADRLDAVTERINDYIENEVDPAANGIAIFASLGDEGFFEAIQLNVQFAEPK